MTQLITKNHQIYVGDVLDQLKLMPSDMVHCMVTSPPYFGLRNYGTAKWEGGDPLCDHSPGRDGWAAKSTLQGSKDTQDHRMDGFPGNSCPKCGATRVDQQIGHEDTPAKYIKKLTEIFAEARRVLRPEGTLWLNLGDSYWGSWGNSGNRPQLDGQSQGQRERTTDYVDRPGYDEHRGRPASSYKVKGLKQKDLVGIPWMAAFALRDSGWWLRSEVIWAKRNGMPESVGDRPSKAHEHIFMFTKSADYYYDQEAVKEESDKGSRNMRDVWHISTVPSRVAHFAVFTPRIPMSCILASTSQRGYCPTCSSPWERVVEKKEMDRDNAPEEYSDRNMAANLAAYRDSLTAAGLEAAPPRKTISWRPTCKCEVDFDLMSCSRCGTALKIEIKDAGEEETKAFEEWKQSCGADSEGQYKGKATKDYASAMAQDPSATKARILAGMLPKLNMKWELNCGCGIAETVPAIVMDPFHGSGTTGAVAEYLGRRYVGIELNPDSAELYDQRCSEVRRYLVGGEPGDKKVKSDDQIQLFQEES